MNFRFRLQKVMDLREKEVKDAQALVEGAQNAIRELNALLVKERDLYFEDRDFLNRCKQNNDWTPIPLYEQSLIKRQNRMMEILQYVRQAKEELEFAKQALVQIKRGHKILENLKDQQKKEHEKKESQKEQKNYDAQAIMRFYARGETQGEPDNEED